MAQSEAVGMSQNLRDNTPQARVTRNTLEASRRSCKFRRLRFHPIITLLTTIGSRSTSEHPFFLHFSSLIGDQQKSRRDIGRSFWLFRLHATKHLHPGTRPICGSNNSQARQLAGDRFVKGGKKLASKMMETRINCSASGLLLGQS